MNRRASSSKAPIVFLAGLLVMVVGAVAAYKLWPAAPQTDPNHPNPVNTPPGPAPNPALKLKPGDVVQTPFIFWGGDVATFVANGGLATKKDSTFDKMGLNVALTPGDDFPQQVKDYLDNKSPLLRGTLSMLGQVSDQLTAKPETTPIVFVQLTWSAGDHFVGRANFKTIDDIKGKRIAIQKAGPHVGMLNDILRTVQVDWKDIHVVWTDDVSGDKGPAALFRKDPTIDACFAISPDMADLTGGLDKTGDGKNNSVDGAHVVVSTKHMNHSIADVYACRSDFYATNPEWVQKFAAGYLKSCEELVDAKKQSAPKYKDAIHLAQDIWGKDPAFKDSVAKEEDVDGLISDSTFVGLPGNIAFFTAKGNLTGFPFKLKQALKLPEDPAAQPFKPSPKEFRKADFDYAALRKLGDLTDKVVSPERFKNVEVGKVEPEQKIFHFPIYFKPGITVFPEADYADQFERALETASLFGNAVVVIRGHGSPDNTIDMFLSAATKQGIVKRSGAQYTLADGTPLDPSNINNVIPVIQKNPTLTYAEAGTTLNLADVIQHLQELSDGRAESVRKSVVSYSQNKGLVLDQSQIRFKGVGCTEPVFPNTNVEAERQQNRRVEFSIFKVPAAQVSDEFDF